MKVHELSFYSQFQCTMGNCPDTCCHGWQILLDNETVRKYMTRPGIQGLRLRTGLKRQNGAAMFKNARGKCPFLAKDRTCNIQLSLGEDYLPDVCRIFPRQRTNYGLFAEELLFLACPEASRLFLNNLDHLYYKTVEREVSYAKSGTNDDTGYLQELLKIRSALAARIMNSSLPRPMLYAGLLSYAKALQQFYISIYPSYSSISHTVYGTPSGCTDGIPVHPNLAAHLKQAGTPFIIPHDITYAMLTSGFYHVFLKFTSPFLYDLCRIYFKKFHRLTPARGDAQLNALQEQLHRNHPRAEHILRGYLTYYLLEEFLNTYEDYSFFRSIATGIMHTHLLELFFALSCEKNHRLTDDDIIRIITVYTRRGRHNDTIEKDMYEIVRNREIGPTGVH